MGIAKQVKIKFFQYFSGTQSDTKDKIMPINPNHKGSENLILYKKGDTTGKVEAGRLGGIASGEAKRKAKTIKQILQDWGDDEPSDAMKKQLAQYGISCEGKTAIEALFAYMGLKALARNTNMNDIAKFAEMYAKYTGQEPAKELNVTGDISSKVRYIEPDEYKAVEDHINKVINDDGTAN